MAMVPNTTKDNLDSNELKEVRVNDAWKRSDSQELTASGVVKPYVREVLLNHATVAIDATIANANTHPGLCYFKNISASGTAGHNVTLAKGNFDGTNNKLTMNAVGDRLLVWFDAYGNGEIILNTGAVSMSAV